MNSPSNALPPAGLKVPASSAAVSTIDNPAVSPVAADGVAHFTPARELDQKSFPHPPRQGSSQLPATIENVEHLLESYGVVSGYNVIKKKLSLKVPFQQGTPDNADQSAFTHIQSLAALNGLPIGTLNHLVATIGDRHPINPVAAWIQGRAWDRVNRLPDFYNTLKHQKDFSPDLKAILMYRWLLSAVAAALMPSGFKARGVLTLQGPQSIGKTSWIAALVPDQMLRESVVKLDHHLDAANKDSLLTALSHWVVEIGELDSSFKKDIARLKGFLTNDQDKLRRPYGAADSEYQRRTVFAATVNDSAFLVDTTGNTRWWTIPVTGVNFAHQIDMQQLFAQVAVDFQKGERWWLSREEEQQLEQFNACHRSVSVIAERITAGVDLDRCGDHRLPPLTATEVLMRLGVANPQNSQAKEAAAVLRLHLGESRRIRGRDTWRIAFQEPKPLLATEGDDADAY